MTWDLAGGGRISLAGGGQGWLWLLAGAVAAGLLLALYRAERRLVSRGAGVALLGLRLVAAATLVVALFEPIAAWSRTETVRGRVFVAADASESMATVDPGRAVGETRLALARGLIAGESAPLARLAADHDVRALAFAREPTPEGPLAALADRLGATKGGEPGGGETDWSGALSAALKAPDDVPVIGVVLLTDGRQNVPGDGAALLDKLAARGVPIYPVLIGSTDPPKDVAVAALRAPESVYKGDVATVEATIKADGLPAGTSLDVTLTRPGLPPMSRAVRVDGSGTRPVATFRVPMEAAGPAVLTVSVAPTLGDARPDNDARSATVAVADDKASVLLVDGEARWEFRYLRNALARDPRVSLDAVVLHQPPTTGTAEATYPLSLPPLPTDPIAADPIARHDAILLGDADLSPETWARLDAFVSARGGTLVILPGPRHWPAQAVSNETARSLLPLLDLRRVDPEPGDDPNHPSLPPGAILSPTPSAIDDPSSWPMLSLGADPASSRSAWSGLPRLPWSLAGRAKPGASVLAVAGGGNGEDSALIAAMPYGLGKVLWVGTDATWRWRHRTGDAIHHRFWGQVVRWASSGGLGAGNRLVRFGPASPRARSGEGIKVQARVAESVPDVGPDFLIAARVLKPGAAPESASAVVPLRPVPGRPRLFEGISPPLPDGPYVIRLDAPGLSTAPGSDTAGPIGEATLTVVPRETPERVELAADRAPLDRLAAATGGRVFTLDDATGLPALLKSRVKTTVRTEETPLWSHPAGLVLFLSVVGVEWALRKRLGLP